LLIGELFYVSLGSGGEGTDYNTKGSSNFPRRLSTSPSRRSLTIFFVVGAVLLVSPLLTVMLWNPDPACQASPARGNFCTASNELYNRTISFLPFVMLIGGVIIAFNMKRIADSSRPATEESSDSSS
jgi:hypothetical protein